MSNLPQSDWILAGRFVDGDLSSAETAQAESRIANDVQFAAAVDEIRQQSNLFSQLPTFKPAEDLQERTLQGSLDQVRAIMGVWPPEESNPTATTVSKTSSDSFDWKSAAALVASLAGVVLIGSMLWPRSLPTGDSNVAMETTAPADNKKHDASKFKGAESDDDGEDDDAAIALDDPSLGKDEFADSLPPSVFPSKPGSYGFDSKSAKKEIAKKDLQMRSAKGGGLMPQTDPAIEDAEFGPFSGTPMKANFAATPAEKGPELAFNTSAPVDQIWCVNQDRNISRETVSQILGLNEIKVQREKPPSSVYTNAEPVEAFYVAATRQQMMLAMSQISNNADIEMIQLPNSVNSPIADAIAQQFTGSNLPDAPNAAAEESQQDKAPRFRKKESQALAQQLFTNSIPRNFVPLGPAPPILNPDSLVLDDDNEADLGVANSLAKQPSADFAGQTRKLANRAKSFEMEDFEADESPSLQNDAAQAAPERERIQSRAGPVQQQQRAQAQTAGEGQSESEETETEEPLHQYLILVRGGEEDLNR